MALNLRQHFKISILYTGVAAVTPFLQLLIQPFIEGNGRLSAIDFSQLAIAESISAFVFIFIGFSLSTAIARFYYDYHDNPGELKKMVSSCFNSILMRGLIIMGVALIVGPFAKHAFSQVELQDFTRYGYAAIFIGISRSINVTAAALYRNQKKVTKFVLISLAFGLVRITGQVVGLFYYEMSFIGYLYGSCIGGGLVTLCILAHTYYQNGFGYSRTIVWTHTLKLFRILLMCRMFF